MYTNAIKKALPTYLLLILLPEIIGLFLYFFIINADYKHEIEIIKSKLSERATDFMAKTTPMDYFKPYFEKLANKIFLLIENGAYEKNPQKAKKEISQAIRNISKTVNENIRCAVFDKNASLINPQDLLDNESRFFSYAWKDIHRIEGGDYKYRRLDQNPIIGFDFNDQALFNKTEYCMPIFSVGKIGLFYFKNANENTNGVIIHVLYKKTSLDLVEARIKDYSTIEQPIIFYDLKTKQRKSSLLGHKDISYDDICSEKYLEACVEDNVVWKSFESDEYKLLLGHVIENPNKYRNQLLVAISIFIIVFIISTFFYFYNIYKENGMFISIRYKLVFIFAIAIYMPTLSLWVLSYTSLNDYRLSIENNIKKGMLDIINKIDLDYKGWEEKIRDRYSQLNNYLKSFSGKKAPTSDEVLQKIKEIAGRNEDFNEYFNWIDIRDINLNQIYTTSVRESIERLEKISKTIAILMLDKYCPERLVQAGLKPSQSDMVVASLFENPISGFSYVFERPNEIIYQNFEAGAYWWWNYYPDKTNPIAFCFANTALRFMVVSYFKSIMKTNYSLGNTRLKLVNHQYVKQVFIPESASNNKDLKELIYLSNVNRTLESSSVNYENNKYLCLCVPGNNMQNCFTLCMYPISEIDYQIEKVRSAIYTVMILLLIISVLTGLLLSKTFITPLNELNRGLEALRKRETETTITIENQDELGHLGNAFNQMMSDIKDLLLAEALQQCLIPTGKYKIPGYDCLIFNKMATNLGGDYADIFDLSDGKLLIVIGDATGHGVSSSLLTAMVKASIFRFAHKNIPLTEIVVNTSEMIYDLLNKKKLMTFCAIILDKTTGEMTICNAGHPYPIIKEKEVGKYRITNTSGFPMGASKRRNSYKTESAILNPEETLFLYTDGFPESENISGDEYGYKRFTKLIADIDTDSAEDMKNKLMEEFKKYHGEAELADDISFIIIRRKPLQDC